MSNTSQPFLWQLNKQYETYNFPNHFEVHLLKKWFKMYLRGKEKKICCKFQQHIHIFPYYAFAICNNNEIVISQAQPLPSLHVLVLDPSRGVLLLSVLAQLLQFSLSKPI